MSAKVTSVPEAVSSALAAALKEVGVKSVAALPKKDYERDTDHNEWYEAGSHTNHLDEKAGQIAFLLRASDAKPTIKQVAFALDVHLPKMVFGMISRGAASLERAHPTAGSRPKAVAEPAA